MALLFLDSCGDHLSAAQITMKWNSGTVAAIVAGFTGNAYSQPNTLVKGVTPASTTVIVGGRFNFTGLTCPLVTPYDAGIAQCTVAVASDGSLYVTDVATTTTVHSAAGLLQIGVWYYIEVQILMNTASAGTMIVRLNGVTVINVTNFKTANGFGGSPFFWSQIRIPQLTGLMDDFYIADGSGPAPFNAFLNAIQVQVVFPNGQGDTDNWVPLAGQNFQEVNETTPDGDTSYNSSTVIGDLDLFVMPAANPNLQVLAVQRLVNARQTAGGLEVLSGAVKFSGVVTLGPGVGLGTIYGYNNQDILSLAPDGTPWTNAKFNACQWGYKKTG